MLFTPFLGPNLHCNCWAKTLYILFASRCVFVLVHPPQTLRLLMMSGSAATVKKGSKQLQLLKSIWDPGSFRDLDYTGWSVQKLWSCFQWFCNFLKQVPTHFRCLGECCDAGVVLRTTKLDLTFHRHGGIELMMTEFYFLCELFLFIILLICHCSLYLKHSVLCTSLR